MDTGISVISNWLPEDEMAIRDRLVEYNVARFGDPDTAGIGIFLRDAQGSIQGGLIGRTARGWLYTQMLFIPEQMRSQGFARRFLEMAESEASRRGCIGAYIDSMNPAAVSAYQKCGYAIAGKVGPLNCGSEIVWLSKRLDGN